MSTLNLVLVTSEGNEVIEAVQAADGVADYVKTIKREIKARFGVLKNWEISEDGTLATSKVDESEVRLVEEGEMGSEMSRTLAEHAKTYVKSTSYSGNDSKICGDAISQDLQGLSPDQVVSVAENILGLSNGELATKYAHLNPGQRRMNAGNRIRGAVKKEVVTEEQVIEMISKTSPVPSTEDE